MFHYIKATLKQGFNILGSYFLWMRKYAKHPSKYPIQERYYRLSTLIRKVSKALDVTLYVNGKDNLLPGQTKCFVCNHLSAFDALALLCTINEPTSFVSKIETKKAPFLGKACQDIDVIFIDRNDLKQSLKAMMKVQEDLSNHTKNWIIFPEGTRNKDNLATLGEFHHGTFRPAVKSNVPIVPIAIFGSQRVFKTSPQYKKYPVQVTFLKPIMPEEYQSLSTHEVAKLCQDAIQKEISFNMRPLDHQLMSKQKNKKYRHTK